MTNLNWKQVQSLLLILGFRFGIRIIFSDLCRRFLLTPAGPSEVFVEPDCVISAGLGYMQQKFPACIGPAGWNVNPGEKETG